MNIYDGSRQRLTKGGRYLSPDLSNNGELVVAAQYTAEGKSSLAFINITDKQHVQSYSHPEGFYISFPAFSADDALVYFIA